MTSTTCHDDRPTSRYGALLALPGVPAVAVAGLTARLPNAMIGLALVLAVTARHSPGKGGLAAAAVVVGGGLAGPAWGRLVDRAGARPVLLACGIGQAALLVGLLVTLAGDVRWPLPLLLAAAVGVLMPPVGPVMRTLWGRLLAGRPELRHAAQAGESVVVDIVYVLAPSTVAIVAATAGALAGLGAAAALTATGCVALTASRHLRGWPVRSAAAVRRGPLRIPGVRPLLMLSLLTTGMITATELAAVRAAHDAGAPATAGWLIAALSAGSIAGGLAYGAWRPRGGDRAHLGGCLALWAAGHVACALVTSPLAVGALLVVIGVVLGPSITAEFSLMAEAAPADTHAEAFAWLTAAGQAGAAGAAAVSGYLGRPGAFLLSAGLAAAALALLPGTAPRTFRPAEPGPRRPPAAPT